ncbi:MAG: hypothetical protein JWM57_1988 [Phycisphaerales bacterium]|nr:hypothetical protein [Phycisphaerales bacterium]
MIERHEQPLQSMPTGGCVRAIVRWNRQWGRSVACGIALAVQGEDASDGRKSHGGLGKLRTAGASLFSALPPAGPALNWRCAFTNIRSKIGRKKMTYVRASAHIPVIELPAAAIPRSPFKFSTPLADTKRDGPFAFRQALGIVRGQCLDGPTRSVAPVGARRHPTRDGAPCLSPTLSQPSVARQQPKQVIPAHGPVISHLSPYPIWRKLARSRVIPKWRTITTKTTNSRFLTDRF